MKYLTCHFVYIYYIYIYSLLISPTHSYNSIQIAILMVTKSLIGNMMIKTRTDKQSKCTAYPVPGQFQTCNQTPLT